MMLTVKFHYKDCNEVCMGTGSHSVILPNQQNINKAKEKTNERLDE